MGIEACGMEVKKLLYLCSTFSTKHNIELYGLSYQSKKIKIEVWSFLPLINPKLFKNFYKEKNKNEINNKNFIYIKSINQLFSLLKKLKKNIFFLNDIPPSIISPFIEIYLTKFKKFTKIGLIENYPIRPKINLVKNIKKNFRRHYAYIIKKMFLFLMNFLFLRIINIFFSKPKFIFIDNSVDFNHYKKKNFLNLFKFDNFDYSKYLKLKKQKKKKKKKIVFLDQNFDHNFEYSIRKIKNSKFNKDLYWKKMNHFFTKLEKFFKFKYEIVIASHHRRPKNNLPSKKKFFFNKTADLVKNSILVLAHYSYSTNFAILFNKPILLLKSDDFDLQTFERNESINLLSKKLDLNVESIDAFEKDIESVNLNVNKKKYLNFFNKFIGFEKGKSFGCKWHVISQALVNSNKIINEK